MKLFKTVLVVFALSLLGAVFGPGVRADEFNKKTVLTFSQPIEVPGQILPAGTYTFALVVSLSDRNVVRIFNADGSQIITTILAVNNYRLNPTGKTVITFQEREGDNPEALKAWFYPGDVFGQEFVYPKSRAVQLAMASQEPVPALATETVPADVQTVPIVAVTPEQKEMPVAEVIETTPQAAPQTVALTTAAQPESENLPATASLVPLIALLGMGSLGFAFALRRFTY